MKTILLVTLCLGSVLAEVRDGRWFNRGTRTVTKVLREQHVVTEVTPSSCVVVQTSLPPCRHLRQLGIIPSQPTRIHTTLPPAMSHSTMEQQNWRPVMHPSDPIVPHAPTPPLRRPPPPTTPTASTWTWDIFNLRAQDVTVTKTMQEMSTTKYLDPNTVVTFSVKGCRPSRLPFDLPECRTSERLNQAVLPEANVIVMAPLQFVPGLDMQHVHPVQPVQQPQAMPTPESQIKIEKKPESEKTEVKP